MQTKHDLKLLSTYLDSQFKFMGFRFGLDGLIGLIPFVGDAVTMTCSMYIVFRAILLKYPTSIIIKMVLNVMIENLMSLIPIVGNLFDFIWKSNVKNIKLLEDYDLNPHATVRSTKAKLWLLVLSVFGFFILSFYLIIKVTTFIIESFLN